MSKEAYATSSLYYYEQVKCEVSKMFCEKQEGPKQSLTIVLKDCDVVKHWSDIKKALRIQDDAATARYLLAWYQDSSGSAWNHSSMCSECHGPLKLYCEKCCIFSNWKSSLTVGLNESSDTFYPAFECDEGNRTSLAKRGTALDQISINALKLRSFCSGDGVSKQLIPVTITSGMSSRQGHLPVASEHLTDVSIEKCNNKASLLANYNCDDFFDNVLTCDKDGYKTKNHNSFIDKKESEEGQVTNEQIGGNQKPEINKAYYSCPFCSLEFADSINGIKQHLSHMKTHKHLLLRTENDKYACVSCSQTFRSLRPAYMHVRLQVGQNTCNTCRQVIHSRCELRRHQVLHRKEVQQYCSWCQKAMVEITFKSFTRHLHSHKNQPNLSAEEQKNCTGTVSLSDMCAICGKCFANKKILKHHMMRAHSDERRFVCDLPDCRRTFKAQSDLITHKIFHGERKEICEHCGKKFHRPVDLNLHMQDHYGRKFECEQCHRRFKAASQLKEHVDAVHKGIKRFSCTVCEAKFTTKCSMKKHMRCVHTDSRPFVCSICNLALKTKPALQKHMLRHSNSRPFRCDDCDVRFRDKSTLTSHRKSKHKDSIYMCKVCSESFHIPHSLSFHMKMCHNEVAFSEIELVPTLYHQEKEKSAVISNSSLSNI